MGSCVWVVVAAAAVGVLAACGARSQLGDGTDGGTNARGSSGASGSGGGGGSSDAAPEPKVRSSKLDLLLVIDNSRSMGEKQGVLRASVATLISRLTNPRCVDARGIAVGDQPASEDQSCPAGSSREMAAVTDMHIGMITTSLGGHGADTCSPRFDPYDPSEDDRGELVARGGVQTYLNRGYLVWDPHQTASPPGHASASALAADVSALIAGAGEVGCGFESTLESWYRFLIDPEPPQAVVVQDNNAVLQGTNTKLLAQRSQFLRPDSAVLIAILSDENDCSVAAGDISWLAGLAAMDPGGEPFRLPHATSECTTNPNDACCRSCALIERAPPAGCRALDADPGCVPREHEELTDALNLRCWEQKRRFGVDFLHPVERYVRGLTSLTVPDRAGAMVPNPLFSDRSGNLAPARHPSLISVVAIVGVPWQDLARDPGDSTGLRYLTAGELASKARWPTIIGDPGRGTAPEDPFMRESIDPRSGSNPITGDGIRPPSSPAATASPINGHEWEPVKRSDLQYACTFRLPAPIACAIATSCDCNPIENERNKPLCQAPDGSYGTTQYYAQAYPGLRQLELLSKLGESAVAASICPRNLDDPGRQDHAYDPAVQAMIDRLKHVIE